MALLEDCLKLLFGEEGSFGTDPKDRGNWTGAAVGVGVNKGTKFGISAAAYPYLDIAALTVAEASSLYTKNYWLAASCNKLPAPLAFLVFDAAVNNGVSKASTLLQATVGVFADGDIGPVTLAAVGKMKVEDACIEYVARRIYFMGGLADWKTFGLGWSRRLAALPYKAQQLKGN